MNIWLKVLYVVLAGGVGALCRMLIEMWIKVPQAWMGLSTLIINTLGCLLIGIFAGWLLVSPWSEVQKQTFAVITMTGFCGGFSTFSSFTLDSVKYFEAGQFWIWVIFGTMTVFLGLFCCALGYWLGQRLA